jgi:hypothetical protein
LGSPIVGSGGAAFPLRLGDMPDTMGIEAFAVRAGALPGHD